MAQKGYFVLFLPGYAVLRGDILGGKAHVVVIENFKEAVVHHQIYDLTEGHIHAVSPARLGQGIGGVRHVFHAARDDDIGIAGLDNLRGQRDGLHTGGAYLVDGDGVGFLGQPGVEACLPAGILA